MSSRSAGDSDPSSKDCWPINWKGRHLITLGTEAFQWFEPYADPAEFAARGKTEARFESSFRCRLPLDNADPRHKKEISIFPLPHPSPLNQRWYGRFPDMLAERLAQVREQLEDKTRT